MRKFRVLVTDIANKTYIVSAKDEDEAYDKISERVCNSGSFSGWERTKNHEYDIEEVENDHKK